VLSVHYDDVRAIDGGLVTGLIMFDLSSAFDTVDHSTLSYVLTQRFGISSSANSWIDSYLSTRTKSFTLCNAQTEAITVDCGVPQGSVLGPLQFICFAEDVSMFLNSTGSDKQMYAGDGIGQLPDGR
jgi:Reverse transcriptase (RNA-dependent DNA polymerase)